MHWLQVGSGFWVGGLRFGSRAGIFALGFCGLGFRVWGSYLGFVRMLVKGTRNTAALGSRMPSCSIRVSAVKPSVATLIQHQ